MNDTTLPSLESLPAPRALAVEEVCTRYESAWQERPQEVPLVEAYLPDWPEPDSEVLLAELLALELDYRKRLGFSFTPEELRTRFPERPWLNALLAHTKSPDASATEPAPDDTESHLGLNSTEPASPDVQTDVTRTFAGVVIPGYDVLAELGRGGMGVVYKVHHRALDRVEALKQILAPEGISQSNLSRFEREAKAVARVRHPNIVQIYHVGHHDDKPYLTLEYCPMGSLKGRLDADPPSTTESAELVETLARAVEVAHRKGVIHRDLKPANVLLAEDGTPKISDFGLAKRLEEASETSAGVVMGTPKYMAPEQARGDTAKLGPACDIYALGTILYECLTGRTPFDGDTAIDVLVRVVNDEPTPPRDFVADVPADLEAICLRCLHKDPSERYPSAEALADDLARYLRGDAVASPSVVEQSTRVRRWRTSILLAVAVLAIVGAGLLWRSWPTLFSGGASVDSSTHRDPLAVRPLRMMHFARIGDELNPAQRIGVDLTRVHFGDAVTVGIELTEPAYFYLIGFNFNGIEQLLWPVDDEGTPSERVVPPKYEKLTFPSNGQVIYLEEDDAKQGVQAYVVVASHKPLPPYAKWRQGVSSLPWQSFPPSSVVWEANAEGVYPFDPNPKADRARLGEVPGTPPLKTLCRALKREEIDVVEAIGFSVFAKEDK